MTKLIDKLAVSLIVIICVSGQNESFSVVTALTAFSVSMIPQYSESKKAALAAQSVYLVLCFINPIFCYGLPVLLYDIAAERSIPLLALSAVTLVSGIRAFGLSDILLCILAVVISLFIELKTERLSAAEKKLIEIRDDSRELNIKLSENNRSLIQLRDNEVYTATLKERNRIAREIHDNVGHLLTRSLLQMGALMIVSDDEVQKQQLGEVKQTIDSALGGIRQSVHDLHDDSIDLRLIVEELLKSADPQFDTTLEYDCSDSMPKEIKLAFAGIIKEALTNAEKHSSGDSVYVSLQEMPAFYRLIVRDNGENERAEDIESKNGGIGLSNMRDRIRNFNGNIRISSSKDGFRIFVSVPKTDTNS